MIVTSEQSSTPAALTSASRTASVRSHTPPVSPASLPSTFQAVSALLWASAAFSLSNTALICALPSSSSASAAQLAPMQRPLSSASAAPTV